MEKFFLVIPLLVTGCVVLPDNAPAWGDPGKPIEFYGLTVTPNEIVEIQAFDRSDGEWVTVATTRSASEATDTVQGAKLYEYSTTVSLAYASNGKDNCFYGYTPVAGCISEVSPQLRVYQPNINPSHTALGKKSTQRMVCENQSRDNSSNTFKKYEPSETPPVITMQWTW